MPQEKIILSSCSVTPHEYVFSPIDSKYSPVYFSLVNSLSKKLLVVELKIIALADPVILVGRLKSTPGKSVSGIVLAFVVEAV